MIYQTYFQQVTQILSAVMAGQGENIEAAARLAAASFAKDGMLYVFGCGHSHKIGRAHV